jgi:hypothetical protein
MDATQNNILTSNQVYTLQMDILKRMKADINEQYPDLNKFEAQAFGAQVLATRISAILCTLNNASYEDIVKAVYDKLNLNDLFDNRHKYLN